MTAHPSPSPSSSVTESPSSSRRSLPASDIVDPLFDRADTTFNSASRKTASFPSSRPPPQTLQSANPPYNCMFIHPPFTNIEGLVLSEEMNYAIMLEHPTWFLDINDFITLDAQPEGAIRYPRDLEPPPPRRQKDVLLRCTFCPRTYAGVNAKSMWTRHVRGKHRVVLSKAWVDTATSARRRPPRTPSTSTSTPGKSTLSTAPLSAAKTSAIKGKARAKPSSTAKPRPFKVGKIIIPAQKPKPVPPVPSASPSPEPAVAPWVKSLSPPPPEGILPPRMRPFNHFRAKLESLEFKAVSPSICSDEAETDAANLSDPIFSLSSRDVGVAASDKSIPFDPTAGLDVGVIVDDLTPEQSCDKDGESIQTDKEVENLLLMDLDEATLAEKVEEDEDMDMEESEDECLHPPISLGGLNGRILGGDASQDLFSLLSRPQVVLSPALSPAELSSNTTSNLNQVSRSREQSVEDSRPATPFEPMNEEPPPLGHFKVSSLAYLMDRNLSASPPPSPDSTAADLPREPPAPEEILMGMGDEPPADTLLAAMQDVFVLKIQKMDAQLTARFMGHLREQFGVEVQLQEMESESECSQQEQMQDDSAAWASLPEGVVRQMMSASSQPAPSEDGLTLEEDRPTLNGAFTAITKEFVQGTSGQLKDDLEVQLKTLVGQLTDELLLPLRDALTLHLKDAIIVKAADSMMEALLVQGEEAQVEFEWRRRVLEREMSRLDRDAAEESVGEENFGQHPLHHLVLGMDSDTATRMPAAAALLC